MKRIAFLMLSLIFALPLMAGSFTGRPMMFAGSYMMRAHGSEANYWNPALLDEHNIDFWWPILDTGIFVSNNSFDLDFYNRIMEKAFISEQDKKLLFKNMNGSLRLNMIAQASLIGLNLGGAALSSSVHFYNKASLSENYLKLLLYGNEEDEYQFTKKHNSFASLSFVDVTVGMGDVTLPLPESIPPIKFGFSGSLLLGIEEVKTTKFDGSLRTGYDGFSINQDVALKTGMGGIGFKGMIGFAASPVENLTLGLTIDNILGNIQWGLAKEEIHYKVSADSVYVADLDLEFFSSEEERFHPDAFSTKFPMELSLGALYEAQMLNISADFKQGFAQSLITSKTSSLSVGIELKQIDVLPIRLGFSTGNSIAPWRVSYSLGLRAKPIEFSLGVQSIQSLLPGYKSKGLALALSFRTGI